MFLNADLLESIEATPDTVLTLEPPEYTNEHVIEVLEQHGAPGTPDALASHQCLVYSNVPDPSRWVYYDGDGVRSQVEVHTAISASNGDFLRQAAVEGLGSCTCVASDKTGTLTVNRQTVRQVWLPDGNSYRVSGEGYAGSGSVTRSDGSALEVEETDRLRELALAVMLLSLLVLLAAKLNHYDAPKAVPVASAVELIHAATLVHDDIIDHAGLRRGRQTVNDRWGNSLTVLLGDWLYTHSMQMALQHGNLAVIRRLCDATLKMTEGDLLRVRSKRGEILTKVRKDRRVPNGLAFMAFHWREAPANVLTNAAVDPLSNRNTRLR